MRGIDKFKERFAGREGEYVLIGGGACDLLFGDAGQDFRATKDLDLVLLVEALTPEFGQVFWDFVREGGYENRQKSSGKPQFYRFSRPEDPAFPAMLELFARTDVSLRGAESGLMPIHIDDEVSSLSAILLDEEYYRLLVENRTSASGVAVLSVEGLIPFKAARTWRGMPESIRQLLLGNAFCPNCGTASFASGYSLRMRDGFVLIGGRCATCGAEIARLCD